MTNRTDPTKWWSIERGLAHFATLPAHECWDWPGVRDKRYRYGVAYDGAKQRKAHRVVWERLRGKVPRGMELDHLCRNRACCNPAHLEVVTRRENVLRGESLQAENARKTECKRGHPFDEANTLLYMREGRQPMRVCRTCKLFETWHRRGKVPPDVWHHASPPG